MKQPELSALLLAFVAVLTFAPEVIAQNAVIWNGPPVTFSKAANSDWTEQENQDRITDKVWITRANTQGLFNIRTETAYAHNSSPADTEWAYGTTANLAPLTFKSWEAWHGGSGGGPASTVGQDAVLHLITENIYIDIKFTSWGGSGGHFSYVRSSPASLSALESWRLQHFNTAANAGDAANTFDFDRDGLVNIVEFAFGLDPKAGSPASLPGPQLTGGVFRASFAEPAGVSGVTYGAEWSSTMAEGSWTPVTDTGTGGTHTFDVPVAGNPRIFLRYLVTVP